MSDKFIQVKVDASDFLKVLDQIAAKVDHIEMKALKEMGDELLRLSSYEVPHDTGALQASGVVTPEGKESVIVGYHTPYAARLHEHPEYRFNKGRKGKYLQDPLQQNLSKWLQVYYNNLNALI